MSCLNIRACNLKSLLCWILVIFGIALAVPSLLLLVRVKGGTASHHAIENHEVPRSVATGEIKTILLWNSFYRAPYWGIGPGQRIFEDLKCAARNCNITVERDELNISSAVLFHVHQLAGRTPPALGHPYQKRVFFMLESPGWSRNKLYRSTSWRSNFHWSMTYRLDSTVPIPYGSVRRKSIAPQVESINQNDGRKLVAVMSSNCNSPGMRSRYIRELGRHIPIDHYGRCGNLHCRRDIDTGDRDCMTMLNSTYKFYLAFENSLCKDYATEKFFKTLPLNVVPVVRGGADYYRFGVLKWFINTADFATPKALAEYLLYLGENSKEYNRYLERRNLFEFNVYYGLKRLPGWCRLCELVNTKQEMDKVDTIDVTTWWNSDTDCTVPDGVQ